MTTVINNPGTQNSGESNSNSMGNLTAALIIGLLLILFLVYGLPAIRRSGMTGGNTPTDVKVNINQEQPQTDNFNGETSPEPTQNTVIERITEPPTTDTESPIMSTVAPIP